MMESFATGYKVTFFDGEKEHDKGYVGIYPMLSFKRFQALLSQRTGLPPGQQSTVFVCRRTQKANSERRQKLPVNENTNFSLLLSQHHPSKERDCYFYVTVKRPRKERKPVRVRRDEVVTGFEEYYESGSSRDDSSPTNQHLDEETRLENAAFKKTQAKNSRQGKPEKTILRRARLPANFQADPMLINLPVDGVMDDYGNKLFMQEESPANPIHRFYKNGGDANQHQSFYPHNIYDGIVQNGMLQNGMYGNSDVLHSQTVFPPQYARFLQNPYEKQQTYGPPSPQFFSNGSVENVASGRSGNVNSQAVICEQCWQAHSRGKPIPFHFCVYDAVVQVFRGPSPLGPIERPV